MLSSVASATDSLRVASKLAQIRLNERAPVLESFIFGARGQPGVMTSAGISLSGLAPVPDDLDVVIVHKLIQERDALAPDETLLTSWFDPTGLNL